MPPLETHADVKANASRLRHSGVLEPETILVVPEGRFRIDVIDIAGDEPQVAPHQRDDRQFDGRSGQQPRGQPVGDLQLAQLHEAGVVDELLPDLRTDTAKVVLRIGRDRVRTTVLIDAVADDAGAFAALSVA